MSTLILWITYTSLMPLIILLGWLIYKEVRIIKQNSSIKDMESVVLPNKNNFFKIEPKKDIKLSWISPRGKENTPYYQLHAKKIYKADKGRQMTGMVYGGWAFGVSGRYSKRNITQKAQWTDMGPAEITFTNQDVWIRGELVRYRYKLSRIEELKISSYGDLLFKMKDAAWPIRIKMSKADIIKFVNIKESIINE